MDSRRNMGTDDERRHQSYYHHTTTRSAMSDPLYAHAPIIIEPPPTYTPAVRPTPAYPLIGYLRYPERPDVVDSPLPPSYRVSQERHLASLQMQRLSTATTVTRTTSFATEVTTMTDSTAQRSNYWADDGSRWPRLRGHELRKHCKGIRSTLLCIGIGVLVLTVTVGIAVGMSFATKSDAVGGGQHQSGFVNETATSSSAMGAHTGFIMPGW